MDLGINPSCQLGIVQGTSLYFTFFFWVIDYSFNTMEGNRFRCCGYSSEQNVLALTMKLTCY